MSFNYASEKRKYDKEWAKLEPLFKREGISVDKIEEIKVSDWEDIKCTRVNLSHETSLEEYCEKKDIPCSDTYFNDLWIENLESNELAGIIKSLSAEDRQIITFLAFEEFTRNDTAKKLQMDPKTLRKKITHIRQTIPIEFLESYRLKEAQ